MITAGEYQQQIQERSYFANRELVVKQPVTGAVEESQRVLNPDAAPDHIANLGIVFVDGFGRVFPQMMDRLSKLRDAQFLPVVFLGSGVEFGGPEAHGLFVAGL